MTLIERIDFDVRSLELYFKRLFCLLRETPETPDPALDEAEGHTTHGYTAFVRPDMVSNIYSMFDFWLNCICKLSADRRKLSLTHKDIRGDNDFEARHKYLTKVAGLDLSGINPSYKHLDILRETRNYLLHAGGHANERLNQKLKSVPDIRVFAGLVVIEDAFIWASLKHARAYLAAAVEALESGAKS